MFVMTISSRYKFASKILMKLRTYFGLPALTDHSTCREHCLEIHLIFFICSFLSLDSFHASFKGRYKWIIWCKWCLFTANTLGMKGTQPGSEKVAKTYKIFTLTKRDLIHFLLYKAKEKGGGGGGGGGGKEHVQDKILSINSYTCYESC